MTLKFADTVFVAGATKSSRADLMDGYEVKHPTALVPMMRW